MINDNGTRRPQFETTRNESTRVQTPEFTPEEPEEVTFEELTLRAANEGTLDVGEEGEELTFEQMTNRASVKQAAQIIPQITRERQQEYIDIIKDNNPWTSRVLSASSSMILGLTEYAPGALKLKGILDRGFINWGLNLGAQVAGKEKSELQIDVNQPLTPTEIIAGKIFDRLEGKSFYSIGEEIGESLQDAFPESPLYREEFLAGTMAKATGNFIPQLLLGVGTAGAGTFASMVTSSALASTTIGSSAYEEAIRNGATEQTAFENALLNMVGSSALEALPMARLASRINKGTGGSFAKVLANGFTGSMEEGITEALQEFYGNALAKSMYDDTRNLMEGVGEAFAAGALLGGVANASLTALMDRYSNAGSPEEMAAARDAMEFIAEHYGDELDTPLSKKELSDFLDSVEIISKLQIDENNELSERGPETIDELLETEDDVFSESEKIPEETVETNQGYGVVEKDFKSTMKRKAKQAWTKWFAWGGSAGDAVKTESTKVNAERDAHAERAMFNLTRLNKAVLEHYGSDKKNIIKAIHDDADPVPRDIMTQLDEALKSKEVREALPKALRGPLMDARRHIDELTDIMRKTHSIQGKLALKFDANKGVYVHRDYALFNPDIEWNEKTIPTAIWNQGVVAAQNILRTKYLKEMAQGRRKNAVSEERIKREALQRVRDLFSADSQSDISSLFRTEAPQIAIEKGNLDVLQERNEIHPAIRRLMGEYDSAAVNYINTVNKMTNTIYKRVFYDKISRQFDGNLFFTERPINVPNYDEYVRAPKGFSGVNSEIEGKWMHRDVLDALSHKDRSDFSNFYKVYLSSLAVAKFAKTAGNVSTHMRNLVGGTMMMGFNGHLLDIATNTDAWKKASTALRSYQNMTDTELEQVRLRLVRLGLSAGGAHSGEFNAAVRDAGFETGNNFIDDLTEQAFANKKGSYHKKFFRGFKRAADVAGRLYRAEDDLIRMVFFELELAQYREADPTITEEEVAELVRDKLYQNYDKLNKFTQELRKFPIGPFVAFPMEVLRTATNTIQQAKKEIGHENPKINKIGWKRVGGMLGTTFGMAVAGAVSQSIMGVDDEEDEAYRNFMPPWDRNSVVLYTDANRGLIRYINTSYTNPYEYFIDPFMGLLKGDDEDTFLERMKISMGQLFEPIMSEEIAVKTLRELIENEKDTGSEIYNPEDFLGDKIAKSLWHMWQGVEPGTLTSARRVFEAQTDEYSTKNVPDELLGLLGLRISTVDVERSFGFRLRENRQRIRNARRRYNSVKYSEGTTQREQMEALRSSNERYREVFNELHELTEAAQGTGVRWATLEQIMKDSGLAQRDINALREGAFVPFEP